MGIQAYPNGSNYISIGKTGGIIGFGVNDSGGPSTAPSGEAYRWKASSGVTQVANAVSAWADSVAALTGAQATEANKPTYAANSLNGKPVITFDGTDRLTFSSTSIGNVHSIAIVYKQANVNDISNVLTGTAAANFLGQNAIRSVTYRANSKASSFDSGLRSKEYKSIMIVRSATGVPVFYEDGYQVPIQTDISTSYLSGDTFSLVGISDFTSFLIDWSIAEIIVYTSALGASSVTQWFNYVSSEYAITPKPTLNKLVHFLGDSHSASFPVANGIVNYLRPLLPSDYSTMIWAEGGRTIALAVADLPNSVTPKLSSSRTREMVVVWLGTNTIWISPGVDGTTAYNAYVSLCNSIRAANANAIIVATLAMPRTATGGYASYEAERIVFNNLIIANYLTFANRLINFSADSRFYPSGAENDTTYFNADKTHLSVAGATALATDHFLPVIIA